MQWARFSILLVVFALLQAGGFLNIIAVSGLKIKPDLLAILAVFFALNGSTAVTARSGAGQRTRSSDRTTPTIAVLFVTGFAADIIAIGSPMGARMLSFGLLGTGLIYIHRVLSVRTIPSQTVATFVFSSAAGVMVHVLELVVGSTGKLSAAALLGTAVYTAAAGALLFPVIAWLLRVRRR